MGAPRGTVGESRNPELQIKYKIVPISPRIKIIIIIKKVSATCRVSEAPESKLGCQFHNRFPVDMLILD